MNKLSELFCIFNENIKLTESYKNKIRTGRDSLRKKINKYYVDKGENSPKHNSQGSYQMHTAILPLDDEDFDLDNGVYLQGHSMDSADWLTPHSVHQDILSAVDGHTDDVFDKSTCVRVNYQDNYHIDLPIYIMGTDVHGDNVAYLAHTENGWTISDPKAFPDWFSNKVKEHGSILRRIVKYLKRWAHYNDVNIKGMAITILSSECFIKNDDDAVSLLRTLTKVIDRLEDNFTCYKPVRPKNEDLFSSYKYYEQQLLLEKLKELKNKLNNAIYDAKNEGDASEILREVFGTSFPRGNSTKTNSSSYLKTSQPESVGEKNRHYA